MPFIRIPKDKVFRRDGSNATVDLLFRTEHMSHVVGATSAGNAPANAPGGVVIFWAGERESYSFYTTDPAEIVDMIEAAG